MNVILHKLPKSLLLLSLLLTNYVYGQDAETIANQYIQNTFQKSRYYNPTKIYKTDSTPTWERATENTQDIYGNRIKAGDWGNFYKKSEDLEAERAQYQQQKSQYITSVSNSVINQLNRETATARANNTILQNRGTTFQSPSITTPAQINDNGYLTSQGKIAISNRNRANATGQAAVNRNIKTFQSLTNSLRATQAQEIQEANSIQAAALLAYHNNNALTALRNYKATHQGSSGQNLLSQIASTNSNTISTSLATHTDYLSKMRDPSSKLYQQKIANQQTIKRAAESAITYVISRVNTLSDSAHAGDVNSINQSSSKSFQNAQANQLQNKFLQSSAAARRTATDQQTYVNRITDNPNLAINPNQPRYEMPAWYHEQVAAKAATLNQINNRLSKQTNQ